MSLAFVTRSFEYATDSSRVFTWSRSNVVDTESSMICKAHGVSGLALLIVQKIRGHRETRFICIGQDVAEALAQFGVSLFG